MYHKEIINFTYLFLGMLDKWENFERKTDEQDKCFLQQNIMELRKQLLDVSMKISNMEFRIKDKHQLEKNVQNVKVSVKKRIHFLLLSKSFIYVFL